MRRSLFVLAVGAFLGSVVTLACVLWVQGAVQNAVAQGGGAAVPSGNGDVNADGAVDISDASYLLGYLFLGGPAPEAIATGLPATGQTKCYDTAGNEIDCDIRTPVPGWPPRPPRLDGPNPDYPIEDASAFAINGCPSEGRFVDYDYAVLDTCTGLMWQKNTPDMNSDGKIDDNDKVTWQDALKYCEGLLALGRHDWRLPNVRELQSIVDYGRYDPAIDPVFEAESNWYWSSSSYVGGPDDAWYVSFVDGYVGGYDGKAFGNFVRAVRSGP